MNTATIFIKTERKVKEEAQKTAEELGFSLSSILNAFLRQFVKTKAVHFSVQDETPNAYLRSLLKQAVPAQTSRMKPVRYTHIFSNREPLERGLNNSAVMSMLWYPAHLS